MKAQDDLHDVSHYQLPCRCLLLFDRRSEPDPSRLQHPQRKSDYRRFRFERICTNIPRAPLDFPNRCVEMKFYLIFIKTAERVNKSIQTGKYSERLIARFPIGCLLCIREVLNTNQIGARSIESLDEFNR